MSYTDVTDISPLAKLKKLEWLSLHDTQVGDFTPLGELKNLKVIYLGDTEITDLTPLMKLPKLKLRGVHCYSGASSHVVGFAERKAHSERVMAPPIESFQRSLDDDQNDGIHGIGEANRGI